MRLGPQFFVLLVILVCRPALTTAASPTTPADDLTSATREFKLPAPSSTTTPRQIWMTNYNRTATALVSQEKGVSLLNLTGKPFALSSSSTERVAVSPHAFCLGADNSVLAVSASDGMRVFATTGPIQKQSADCTSVFHKGLSASIIQKINHQSFADVTACAPFGLDASEHALVPYRSVAVKQGSAISLGTILFIPQLVGLKLGGSETSMTHDGYVIAVDHVDSGDIRPGLPEALHVDVFIGDQRDLLSSTPQRGDQSFKLITARVIKNQALRAVLLNRRSCPISHKATPAVRN